MEKRSRALPTGSTPHSYGDIFTRLLRRGTIRLDAAMVPTAKAIARIRNSRTGTYSFIASPLCVETLDGLRQRRHHLEGVADDPVVRHLEDGRFGVLVDGDDAPRRRHARQMLDRAGDAHGHVELGRHRLSRLPHLVGVRS